MGDGEGEGLAWDQDVILTRLDSTWIVSYSVLF